MEAVVAPSDAVSRSEVVRANGPSASVRVELGGDVIGLLELLEQRREELPRRVELVASDEEALIALNGVQNEPLVRILTYPNEMSVFKINHVKRIASVAPA